MWRRGGERRKLKRINPKSSPSDNSPDPVPEPVEVNFKAKAKRAFRKGVTIAGLARSARSASSRKSASTTLDEDDWYLGEWLLESSDEEDEGVGEDEAFGKLCQVLNVRETRCISRCLSAHTSHISLRYHLLREEQIKSLAAALINDGRVEALDLAGCHIGASGARWLSEMLIVNSFIRDLDLSENYLRTDGLRFLVDSMKINITVSCLKLGMNELRDQDSSMLLEMLEVNTTLQNLYLSSNSFSMTAGSHFGNLLSVSDSLIKLDLSWNKFRRDGVVLLLHGLQSNNSLKELDLSWNGIGVEGSKAIERCLQENTTLECLDISYNRITREAFQRVLQGLIQNRSLQTLKIGGNPITTEGVLDFMEAVASLPPDIMTELKEVDFKDVGVGKDFKQFHTELLKKRNITIRHGAPVRQDDMTRVDLSTVIHSEQPIYILFDCMRRSNLRVTDIFHSFDKDKSNTLTRQELKHGLLTMNVPLSSRALDLLIKHTDADNDGEISLAELLSVQKDYMKYLSNRRAAGDEEEKTTLVDTARRRVKAFTAATV